MINDWNISCAKRIDRQLGDFSCSYTFTPVMIRITYNSFYSSGHTLILILLGAFFKKRLFCPRFGSCEIPIIPPCLPCVSRNRHSNRSQNMNALDSLDGFLQQSELPLFLSHSILVMVDSLCKPHYLHYDINCLYICFNPCYGGFALQAAIPALRH